MFPNAPLIGGDARTFFDVFLYAIFCALIVYTLISPVINPFMIWPIVVMLPIIGILDKTLFLMARSDHYWIALVCCLFPNDALISLSLVWIAIWWGAATSKLNHHFPSVVAAMISNHPFLRFSFLKKRLYKQYPEDLRPSNFTKFLAHFGTFLEYVFPLLLLFGTGGTITEIGLVIMICFHLFISSSIPLGVPLEWNVIMVYVGFILFGIYADVDVLYLVPYMHKDLIFMLILMLIVIPIIGNIFPKHVSFLLSMRYYAGNWPFSIWLFQKGSEQKLDDYLVKSSLTLPKQLAPFYDAPIIEALETRVIAFRHMHLHGRSLQFLLPKAVDEIDDYTFRDGELVAAVALGWNFGDGHLHGKQLLEAIQKRCQFESGEVRCIMVESQPAFHKTQAWKIMDAKEGLLEKGAFKVEELLALQPFKTD